MNINEIIESIISEYINENYQSFSLDDVLKTIPKEVINAVDEFHQTKEMTIFHINEFPDIFIYLYDNTINEFKTASTKFPKNIFINLFFGIS